VVRLTTHTQKKNRYNNNKQFRLLSKRLDLFLWHPILVLVLSILGFLGKGAAPSCWTAWWGNGWGLFCFVFCLFFCFPWSYGPCITRRNSEVVSSDDWLVFGSFCPQGRLQMGPKVTHYSLRKVVPSVVFTRQQLHCPTAATLSGQLLPPARWGCSVLSTALSPTRVAQQSPTSHLWGGWLATPHTHTLSLCSLIRLVP
jgi:hypothetical protein